MMPMQPQGGPQPPQAPPIPQMPMPPAGPAPQQQGTPPVTIDAVMDLLRNDKLRGFRIDIETDQLVDADENAEKQSRMEFVQAVGGLMQGAVQAMSTPAGPAIGPAIAETILFAVRGFKAGRSLEETFESALEKLTNAPPPPPPGQGPDPKTAVEMRKLDLQEKQHQDNVALRQSEIATNAQIKNQSLAQNAAIKNDALAQHDALERLRLEHQAALAERDRQHEHLVVDLNRRHEAAMEALRAHIKAAQAPQQPQIIAPNSSPEVF